MTRALLAALCLLICLAVALFVVGHSYSIYDDAYIYFRYVDNLFAGCGLRFNCADAPVEGFTSPLYLLMLASSRLFTRDLETASQILGALSLAAALCLTVATALHPRLRSPSPSVAVVTAIAVAALLALDHELLLNAVSGLETSLACLAVAMVFRLSLDGLPVAVALLAVCVRPELTVLLILPAARRPRSLLLIAAVLGAMTALRWALFHDYLPNTFWAKSGGTAQHLSLGAQYTYDAVCEFPAIVLAPLALFAAGVRRAVGYLLIGAALAFAFFLHSGGDTFAYSRLAAPFVPTLSMLALVGAGRALDRWRFPAALAPATLGGALALHALVAHALPPQHGFANVERWKTVGRWLSASHPGARLATVPIGAIGYFSRLPLIDLVGLTSREVARGGRVPSEMLTRSWIGHERENTDWVLAQKPDLIVFTKWRERPWTLPDARAGFWAEWRLLSAIRDGRAPYEIAPAEIAPGVHWLIFVRSRP